MAVLTKRSTKGSALTHAEMDANLEYLDAKLGTDGADGADGAPGATGATGATGAPGVDGATVSGLILGVVDSELESVDHDTDLNIAVFTYTSGYKFTVNTVIP